FPFPRALRARWDAPGRDGLRGALAAREGLHRLGPLPHGGGRHVHGRRAVARGDDRGGGSRDRLHPDHRTRPDTRRRPGDRGGDGRPEARGVLLMTAPQTASTLLRIAIAGSVDDGKSTLLGRLLFDSKLVLEDQLAAVEQTSKRRGDG